MLIAYGWFCRDGISRSGKLGRLSQKHLSFNGSACFVEISLQCSIWIAKIPFRNMMMLAVSFHFHHHLNLNLLPQPKFGFHPDPIRELRSWLIIRLAAVNSNWGRKRNRQSCTLHFDWAKESLVHGCDCSDIEKKLPGNQLEIRTNLLSWLWNILEWVISVVWLALVDIFPRIQLTFTQYTHHFRPPGHTASEKPQARNTNQPQYLKFLAEQSDSCNVWCESITIHEFRIISSMSSLQRMLHTTIGDAVWIFCLERAKPSIHPISSWQMSGTLLEHITAKWIHHPLWEIRSRDLLQKKWLIV